ncbi:MAG TPA: hypothetical protein ENN46_04490 [Candidatus Woesearchaeota archaeon]|nr:hypothetical protein [Candidatus Woesearchaeota archaeon]
MKYETHSEASEKASKKEESYVAPDIEEIKELILKNAIFKEVKGARPFRRAYFSNESILLFSSGRREDKFNIINIIGDNKCSRVHLCFSEDCTDRTCFIMSKDNLSEGKVNVEISYSSPLKDFILTTSSDDELKVFLLCFEKMPIEKRIIHKVIVERTKDNENTLKEEFEVNKRVI